MFASRSGPRLYPGRVDGGSLQQRVEGTIGGRVAISVFIAVTLIAVGVINLPESSLRRSLSTKTQPYLNALGLDQAWGVFAPDPRRNSIRLEVRLTYTDGETQTWSAPVRDDLVGTYSDYRWRKFEENLINEGSGEGGSAERLGRWVVRERRERSELPNSVAVVSASAQLPPPGPQAGDPQRYNEQVLLTFDPEQPAGRVP